MIDKIQKAEIDDLYDGTFACIRELAELFGINTSELMFYVDYKGRRKKQFEATKRWRKKNPEKAKIMNDKAAKKYYKSEKGRANLHKRYLRLKAEGYFKTDKFKAMMRKYYLKNREKDKKRRRKYYLKLKKTGYFETKEFRNKDINII